MNKYKTRWNQKRIEETKTELQSYKQVEPRDKGKKPGFAKRTGLSLASEIELELEVRDLCFALLRSWLNRVEQLVDDCF